MGINPALEAVIPGSWEICRDCPYIICLIDVASDIANSVQVVDIVSLS